MLSQLRKFKLIAAFAKARRADYAELASAEWISLTRVLLKLVIGGGLALIGSFFFLVFLSVAVIVTAWDSDMRVLVSWLVAVAWLAVGAGGGLAIYFALRGIDPFRHVRDEFGKDIAVVRSAL